MGYREMKEEEKKRRRREERKEEGRRKREERRTGENEEERGGDKRRRGRKRRRNFSQQTLGCRIFSLQLFNGTDRAAGCDQRWFTLCDIRNPIAVPPRWHSAMPEWEGGIARS